jgi:ferrous iron transport protein B
MSNCNHCPFKKNCKIVLVGNPNVGKSAVFNMLSHKYTEVSNYPGTTISVAVAQIHIGTLVDTPGIYSLTGDSQI